jgi:DNA-binding MarR family transcriptional regulator
MDRHTLKRELLEEIVSHQPAAAMRSMRRWPGGAVSLVHMQVLTTLDVDGPLPMRGLAEALDVSQASATGIVDRMEQRGLVERRRDGEDRRVVHVAITDAGRDVIGGFASERREKLEMLLDYLTDDELSSFLVGARAMARAREQLHAKLQAEHEAAHPGVRFHTDVPASAAASSPGDETREAGR